MNKYSFFTIFIAIVAILALIFLGYLTIDQALEFISSCIDKILSVFEKIP